MVDETQKDIGFIKYSGNMVPHGVIDAGTAGAALTGLDEVLRFFNEKQSPEFARLDYEVPVRTEGGSWIATVLWLGGGAFSLSYLKKAGEKMAENDFKDIGMADVLKKSLSALQCLIKLVKHTGVFKKWGDQKILWRNNGDEVGFPDENGAYLFLPSEYIRWYDNLPVKTINKLVVSVRLGRVLSVGLTDGDVVTIEAPDKLLFMEDIPEEEDDYLFPELENGAKVKLEGRLIRGNEAANSVGLEYMGHILNCHPEHGNIRQYKAALFLQCVVEGYVTRFTKQRFVADKRPTILIEKVVPLETDEQYSLFKG
jgi:hypothetical protein